jgi:quercetin 2,3-dioxygenase
MYGTVIGPGDVQRMSASIGILHTEFNPSKVDPVHFLQIWMIPDRVGFAAELRAKGFSDR